MRQGKFRIKKRFFVVLAVLIYVAACFGQQFWQIYRLEREIEAYTATKLALIEKQHLLQEEIKLLENPSYIERVAREELGLIKPGETLLVPAIVSDVPVVKPVDITPDNIH